MPEAIEVYLAELDDALVAARVQARREALADAREFLHAELWSCRRQRPDLDATRAFALVERAFGSAAEVAAAYRDAEGGDLPPRELLRRRRRFASYAPGWLLECRRCRRAGYLAEHSLLTVRWLAWSRHARRLGWCRGCRRLRWLLLTRI